MQNKARALMYHSGNPQIRFILKCIPSSQFLLRVNSHRCRTIGMSTEQRFKRVSTAAKRLLPLRDKLVGCTPILRWAGAFELSRKDEQSTGSPIQAGQGL